MHLGPSRVDCVLPITSYLTLCGGISPGFWTKTAQTPCCYVQTLMSPRNSSVELTMPNGMILVGGTLVRWLGNEGGALMRGISALNQRGSGSFLAPSSVWWYNDKSATRKTALPWPRCTLILVMERCQNSHSPMIHHTFTFSLCRRWFHTKCGTGHYVLASELLHQRC